MKSNVIRIFFALSKVAALGTFHSIGVELASGENDIDLFNDELETCSAEIVNRKSKNFTATGIYRPPKQDIKVFRNY